MALPKFNPLSLFAEFWLDLVVVLFFGWAFAQVDASSSTVIAACRATWVAFHVLFCAAYFRIKPRVDAVPQPAVREEELERLALLRKTFLIKAAVTMFLHLVTDLPQPLIMGGVVSTVLLLPARRDPSNSFIKKYLLAPAPGAGGKQSPESPSAAPPGGTPPQASAGPSARGAPPPALRSGTPARASTAPTLPRRIAGAGRPLRRLAAAPLRRAAPRHLRIRAGQAQATPRVR
eukprot:jgi/Tetstr1/438932/TSEL_002949.t1